ncbi:MAG: ABC transporter ATP-binding protein [Anaerolineae bacterium]|nr:ABC transporter ATP-binding protein [Anaerolineae bacterium]
MQPDAYPAVQTRKLSQTIGDFTLRDIDLLVPAGVLCALLGESGSGKTTLVKLVLGLTDPDAGQRLIFGQDIDQGQPQTRIRYAPQVNVLPDGITVREALRFTTFLSGQHIADAASIEAALTAVRLPVSFDSKVAMLTGLQRKYLWLARALIGQPQLLVLDEPAGSLTGSQRQEFLTTLREVSTGRTVIYTTATPADAFEASEYLAILLKGRLVAQGPTDGILENADYALFQMTIRGDASTVRELLTEEAWIHAIHVAQQDDHEEWIVAVHDEYQAGRGLLRAVLADRSLSVINYKQLRPRLHDILNQTETIRTS